MTQPNNTHPNIHQDLFDQIGLYHNSNLLATDYSITHEVNGMMKLNVEFIVQSILKDQEKFIVIKVNPEEQPEYFL